ncbi:MAG: DNA recombination protein RmuC [bacterium]|nr:DNA recombination protein RmuC [bacterium]
MTEVLPAIVGVIIGAGIVLAVVVLRRRNAADVARELIRAADQQKLEDLDRVITQLKESFGALSREALSANSEEFLKLAHTRMEQETTKGAQTLEGKKKLIDATLETIRAKMAEVGTTLQTLDKDRREAHGGLVKHLQNVSQVTTTLQETTDHLRQALASPQARGQWGERMAEDVLRAAGLVEGINYTKQASAAEGSRPDFTFLLPRDLRVNMDVKFPGSNYLAYLNAADETSADLAKKAFLRDVRSRIKEVTRREGYVDPAAGTVDYVLVFIPNEQIYGFIHQNDPGLLDDALAMKVVLCSPLTLYAILAVIHQSVENFQLERASNEILGLLAEFRKQWDKYVELTEKMGRRLDDAVKAYEELTTTRTKQLERQLDRIDDLQARKLPGGE